MTQQLEWAEEACSCFSVQASVLPATKGQCHRVHWGSHPGLLSVGPGPCWGMGEGAEELEGRLSPGHLASSVTTVGYSGLGPWPEGVASWNLPLQQGLSTDQRTQTGCWMSAPRQGDQPAQEPSLSQGLSLQGWKVTPGTWTSKMRSNVT